MSISSRSILITSASGKIGSELIPLLLSTPSSTSWKLVLPTRNASRLTVILPTPLPSNVIVAEGDTSDCRWLESLLRTHSVDSVLSNFAGIEEAILALNLWGVCERVGIKHLVFISACLDCSPEAVVKGGLKNTSAAHVVAKYPLEMKLRYGEPAFTWTVLGPSLFYTGDTMGKTAIMEYGTLFFPLGRSGQSRVDPRDIALGVLRALEDRGRVYHGRKIMIGSRETYTGEDTARLWAKALGKEVRTPGGSVEELQQLEDAIVGTGEGRAWARDLALMVRQFDVEGFGMTEEQYREQVEFLGRESSSYREFVQATAESWLKKKEASA